MSQKIDLKMLGNITELKYVNTENVLRYRIIMRFLYLQYERLNYWLKPEQIYKGIMEWEFVKDYTLEQCKIDLEQLVTWKNLSSRHDGGRAVTIEEYLKKKYQYLITPYSIEIERFLSGLEDIKGYGGSLEPTLLDKIIDILTRINEKQGKFNSKEALDIWNDLYESFQKLNQTSMDYIASLQTNTTEELMNTTSFLLYKDSITLYLQEFIQALQRKSLKVEANMKQINKETNIKKDFFNNIIAGEWAIPKLEETISKEEYLEDLLRKWRRFESWFLGDSDSFSEVTLLEKASKDAILQIVKSTIRIQERKRSTISRKKELDYLGQWFYHIENIEEAHRLSAYAFGLFPTRHLQGFDNRDSDSQEMSMWDEIPINLILKSRSRNKGERTSTDVEPIKIHDSQKKAIKKALLIQRKRELNFLIKMVNRGQMTIGDMEKVSSTDRVQLLDWISRCITTQKLSIHEQECIEITLKRPEGATYAILQCEDGDLEMLNYQLTFLIINDLIWNNLLEWIGKEHYE